MKRIQQHVKKTRRGGNGSLPDLRTPSGRPMAYRVTGGTWARLAGLTVFFTPFITNMVGVSR